MTLPEPSPAPRRIDYVSLDEVVPAERNPRLHESFETVRESVRRFGFVDGAVHDGRTGRIIAGHGRTEVLVAMRDAGEDPPDGVLLREDGAWLMPLQVGWSSRTDSDAEALLVALNRLTETGGWATQGLTELLVELREVEPAAFDVTGYDDQALDDMLAGLADDDYDGLPDPDDLDAAPEPPSPERVCSREGDVWLIGRHRLVVGDSTDGAVVRRALGGAQAQMLLTDPPYGVAYVGLPWSLARQQGQTVKNDDMTPEQLRELLVAAFGHAREALVPGGSFYVFSPSGRPETVFRNAMDEAGLMMRWQIVWVKDQLVLGQSDYHPRHETLFFGWQLEGEPQAPPELFEEEHETALYGWKEGAPHEWRGGRKQTTVWAFPRPKASKGHPTMKPVALVRRAVVNSTRPGETRGRVLDLFGGSGSTMVACESAQRSASLVELDPRYADVIVARMWETFGLDGVRERDGSRWSEVGAGAGSGAGGGSE